MAGRVFLGGVPADKPGTPVPADSLLTLKEKARKYASRSGYKLAKALDVFAVDPAGMTACDIGASNGGFTDCLLQHGAAHVFAVDVAYGILAGAAWEDERVTVMERTNARNLTLEQLEAFGRRAAALSAGHGRCFLHFPQAHFPRRRSGAAGGRGMSLPDKAPVRGPTPAAGEKRHRQGPASCRRCCSPWPPPRGTAGCFCGG